MMNLLLVRHGETDLNAGETFRGRFDAELNETGLHQAALLARYLGQNIINSIYTSPLKRARQTADLLAAPHKIVPETRSELTDIDFGDFQGLTRKEASNRFPDIYRKWLEEPEGVNFPHGENLKDVNERLSRFTDLMGEKTGTVAIVSHRVVLKLFILRLLGLPASKFWHIKLDTCGITVFSIVTGGYALVRHNDTSFLGRFLELYASDF